MDDLCFVFWKDIRDRFYFHNNFVIAEKVWNVILFEQNVFVLNLDFLLGNEWNISS